MRHQLPTEAEAQVRRPIPRGCGVRHSEPDATCQRTRNHPGWHRAEYGAPLPSTDPRSGQAVMVAQVVSWSW